MSTPLDIGPIRALYLPMIEATDRKPICTQITGLCEPLLGTAQYGRLPEFVEIKCIDHVCRWLPISEYDTSGVFQARQLAELAESKSYVGYLLISLMLIDHEQPTDALAQADARAALRTELPLLAVRLDTPAADVELGNQILDLVDRLSN